MKAAAPSKAGNRKEAITGIRYDPRSINNIYMMQNGEIKKIPLNEIREEQRSFRDMTWKEYDKLDKLRMPQIYIRESDCE